LKVGEATDRKSPETLTAVWNLSWAWCTLEHMFDNDIEEEQFSELSTQVLEQLTADGWAWADESELDRHVIPAGLDDWLPGPHLAAVLSSIDDSKLNGFDLVVVLRARARQASHDQARYYNTISEVARAVPTGRDGIPDRSEEWFEYAADELRAALTLTRRAADSEIDFAYHLTERLPQLSEALLAGDIDIRRARTIFHGVGHLADASAVDVAEAAVREASGLTTGQLRARVQKFCIDINPDDAAERYTHGVEDRRVVSAFNPDGTANLMGLQSPIDRVTAANRHINRLARSLKRAGDSRTLDQLRADVYLDLVTGSGAGSAKNNGSVDITVDLATLAELNDVSAELAGMGPVIADIARQVVAEQHGGSWSYTVTDNGHPVATGTTRRRPTAAIKRQVQARYPTCVFPGCRMPARDCDLDHRVPWAESGPTDTDHLGPLCRHDHIVRHKAGWTVHRNPDGSYIFTSRLGHTYRTSGLPP